MPFARRLAVALALLAAALLGAAVMRLAPPPDADILDLGGGDAR
ncbi:MAG: hypothetical protein ACK4WC_17135 [Rubrimonas sp.]